MSEGPTRRCPYCGGSGPIVHPDIALCACGVAYRTVPATNFHYRPGSFATQIVSHRDRMRRLVQRLDWGEGTHRVLDVGAGHGLLHEAIVAAGVRLDRYVAVEPSMPLARDLTRGGLEVVRGPVEQLPVSAQFDTIFILGVDYLFADIHATYAALASRLAPTGTIVAQRNVFLEQTAYMRARAIRRRHDLFGVNPIIMQWFHVEQYLSFVARYFTIAGVTRDTEAGGGFTVTWTGRPGGSAGAVVGCAEEARAILARLGA